MRWVTKRAGVTQTAKNTRKTAQSWVFHKNLHTFPPPPDNTSVLYVQHVFVICYSIKVPSHLGMSPLHITLPSSRWHVMVSAPCVLMKPSSQTTEMELPSWKLSPKRLAFNGMPGSGHSLRPKACNEKKDNKIEWQTLLCQWGGVGR